MAGDGADGDQQRQRAGQHERRRPEVDAGLELLSQSRITHQATGQAIRLATRTGSAELPDEQPDDVLAGGAEDLADGDLTPSPLHGESGQAEQAEAGDGDGQGRGECENLSAHFVTFIETGEVVLDEAGFERDVGQHAAPNLLGLAPETGRVG